MNASPHIVVIGGGIAGLAAAETLSRFAQPGHGGPTVTLLESRRATGGRAGSFVEPQTGQTTDYCQHVAMGCCTNLLAMLRRLDVIDDWQRYESLTFFHPRSGRVPFSPSRWLPAPLHLDAALGGLKYLSFGQRMRIRYGIARLMRTSAASLTESTAAEWLASNRQHAPERQLFWDVILVSALGDLSENVSMAAARKVIIDGFAGSVGASDVWVPRRPLSEIFGERTQAKLIQRGVDVRCGSIVRGLQRLAGGRFQIQLAGDEPPLDADHVILATSFSVASRLLRACGDHDPLCDRLDQLRVSPITGVHLWLDRPLTKLPHIAMVGTLAQWLFCQPIDDDGSGVQPTEFYHQVVISGRHALTDQPKDQWIGVIMRELESAFPETGQPTLLRWKIVSDPQAVFSVSPDSERARPAIGDFPDGIALAGDYVQTGWPATMEGAVISGQRAAAVACQRFGIAPPAPAPPLVRGWLARLLTR